MGVIEYQQGNYEQALKHFKKAVSRDGSLSDARFYVAETYLKLGDRRKAIEAYEKTLEVDPNYFSARAKLDMLTERSNNQSPQ